LVDWGGEREKLVVLRGGDIYSKAYKGQVKSLVENKQ
jgi:hypothetical protein